MEKSTLVHSFMLYLTIRKFPVLFSELKSGEFTKSYTKNNELKIDFISRKEYILAMAYDASNT